MVSNSGAAQKQALPSRTTPDRRTNIILFGLPEKDSLEDTKSIVDEVFSFVVGKVVGWVVENPVTHLTRYPLDPF